MVSPDPGKLGAHDYDAMLDRVLAHDRALAWGLAPGEQKAALSDDTAIGALHPVIAAHILPDLMRQLGRIIDNPVLAQRPIERIVGLRPGTPLNPSERRSLVVRPDLQQRLRAGDPTLTVLRRRREHSLDHPANRWIVGALGRVRRALLLTEMALQKACPGLDALGGCPRIR